MLDQDTLKKLYRKLRNDNMRHQMKIKQVQSDTSITSGDRALVVAGHKALIADNQELMEMIAACFE